MRGYTKGDNQLFDLGLSDEELMERGVTLGADVPYCVMGGTARARGIGDILEKLPAPPQCHVIIAKPEYFRIDSICLWTYQTSSNSSET